MPQWKAEELNEKTVSCTFRDKSGVWEAIGKLAAEPTEAGMSVEIWIQEVTPDRQMMLNRIALPAAYIGKLEKSEDGESDFILPGELNLAREDES